jgi:mycothiol synthase
VVTRADIRVTGQLDSAVARQVLDLVRRAAAEDGVDPLSEHVMLHLRYGGHPDARDLLVYADQELAGYAHLDSADPQDGPSGELIIDPARRRHGLGPALARALIAEAGNQPLRLWAHGDRPAAARLAAAGGFERTRALWQMRRPLREPFDEPRLPAGITVRSFRAGQDEDAWIALNALAFSQHPEQGSWTRADLELREQEPWFDPAGFFLAERDRRLVGFHWTKIHEGAQPKDHGAHEAKDAGAHEASASARDPIGEVYVVGVDPAERGSGLGRALTLTGLRYLRSRGLPEVMLYVDEANTPAIRLYEALGFARWHTDAMFTHWPAGSARPAGAA